MNQIDRINEIMSKEKSSYKRRQMMNVLRGLELEWERTQRAEDAG